VAGLACVIGIGQLEAAMDELLPQNRFVSEHVVFLVLLIPTIIVLAAAVLSLV
jgi:hypothetical protein